LGSTARLKGAGCLLVDELRPESDLRAAQAARRLGVPVVGDLAGIREGGPALLAHLDYAIVSEDGARRLGGSADCRKACERIRSMGPRSVVITLGRRGLAFHDGKRFGRMKAFRVKVVDTTGAGDVFHGAFCWGLVEGLAFEENLAFASATAAMKCRRIGGRAGIPTRREVLRFLREHKADLA
jgi:sulfofructose kinase